MSYTAPQFHAEGFDCPHCFTYAHMRWSQLLSGGREFIDYWVADCAKCRGLSVWRDLGGDRGGIMIDPGIALAPPAHPDMPAACLADYEEARTIASISPRGAAALLRLAVQKLCIYLGQPGKNINDDIRSLVQAGLPVDAQQALDVLRVAGNNAVHPGELDVNASPELVAASFGLINLIVDQQISQKKRVASLFAGLPAGALSAIAKRDGTA